jgi:hypothetical protein
MFGAVVALLPADALVIERQRDILRGILEGQQIEGLEHESEHLVAQTRGFGLPQFVHRLTRQEVAALVIGVENSEDVQERGLAGAWKTP